MADIQSRALARLDDYASPDFHQRYAVTILDLIRSELSHELLDTELQTLDALFFNPLKQRYNGPIAENEHYHAGISFTIVMWHLPDGTVKPSHPIYNIYDLLAVTHSILAKKYGCLPIDADCGKKDKWWDVSAKYTLNAPPLGTEDLRPISVTRILESLCECCNAFAISKRLREGLPTMAGYSFPNGVNDPDRPSYPTFGVSAGGNSSQRRIIARDRLARFAPDLHDTPKGTSTFWICGNCAEQAYWPSPGDSQQVKYDGMTVKIRHSEFRRVEANCENCVEMATRMAKGGFVLKDLANLRPPPWARRHTTTPVLRMNDGRPAVLRMENGEEALLRLVNGVVEKVPAVARWVDGQMLPIRGETVRQSGDPRSAFSTMLEL